MLHSIRQPEKDDEVTIGIFMLHFFRTRLKEAYIANVSLAKSARTFICCPEFYFFFVNL